MVDSETSLQWCSSPTAFQAGRAYEPVEWRDNPRFTLSPSEGPTTALVRNVVRHRAPRIDKIPQVQAKDSSPKRFSDEGAAFTQSLAFPADARLNEFPPNVLLVSSDNVVFHVHHHQLLRLSGNDFAGLVWDSPELRTGRPLVVYADQDAAVLDFVLHVFYDIVSRVGPISFDALASAFCALVSYGVCMQEAAALGTPLAEALMRFGPLRAIEVYALAAEHDLEHIAVPVSAYLIAYPLLQLPEELAFRISPRYLMRLHNLQQDRMTALRGLLLTLPEFHPPTFSCSLAKQKHFVCRPWGVALADLAWDAKPGMSPWLAMLIRVLNSRADISAIALQQHLNFLSRTLECLDCKDAMSQRVRGIVRTWNITKVRFCSRPRVPRRRFTARSSAQFDTYSWCSAGEIILGVRERRRPQPVPRSRFVSIRRGPCCRTRRACVSLRAAQSTLRCPLHELAPLGCLEFVQKQSSAPWPACIYGTRDPAHSMCIATKLSTGTC